jgi:hypothetical protein
VRTLGALEARYADDHVPLALVLGALGALSAVRRLLPDGPGSPTKSTPDGADAPVDSFALLLLGAIAAHDRLLALVGPTLANRGADRTPTAEEPRRLEGLLR